MNRWDYYRQMRVCAAEVRARHGLTSPRVLRSDMRRIYKAYGIKIDYWPLPAKVRGLYVNDGDGVHVAIKEGLPAEPMVFTLAHELKHHLYDQSRVGTSCSQRNEHEELEIGAEVFAAQFIFPEEDFLRSAGELGMTGRDSWTPENIVRLKRETLTTLSYAALVKRCEWLGFVERGALKRVAWRKLEDRLYGVPIYRQRLAIAGRDRTAG